MNRKELSQNHWKYYLMLEKRFVESIEFVELHEDNFDAFSNGYALLIQAIGAELQSWDTVKINKFASRAIAYLLNCENEKLPKEIMVAFE